MSLERLKFSAEILEADVHSILTKNYINSMSDYFELQRNWLHRAYSVFNDLDKYMILMSLISKTFKSYSEYFIKYDFDQFYSVNEYEIKRINIANISQQLAISKETTRRKVLELEKIGLLKKYKKSVCIQRSGYTVQKPINSIILISRFMSNLSKLLKENKVITEEISSIEFEHLVKKNYTQCWNYFLEFQISLLTEFKKKFFREYETFSVWEMIVYNQNLALNKKLRNNYKNLDILKEDNLYHLHKLTEPLGLNAMTISDLTGIPRPTVIRKLDKLVKSKYILKNNNGLYQVSRSQRVKEINEFRIQKVTRISNLVCRFFNTVRFYKN